MLGDQLLDAAPWGLNACLWLGALIATGYGLAYRWQTDLMRTERWFIVPVCALALLYLGHDAALLKLVTTSGVLVALAFGIQRGQVARLRAHESMVPDPPGLLTVGVSALVRLPRFLAREIEQILTNGTNHASDRISADGLERARPGGWSRAPPLSPPYRLPSVPINYAGLFALGWGILYGIVLVGTSLMSREQVLSLHERKAFCGFYLDCHLGVSVENVAHASFVGEGATQVEASGLFYLITVRVSSDAVRATLPFAHPQATLVDLHGATYRRSIVAEHALAAFQQRPLNAHSCRH